MCQTCQTLYRVTVNDYSGGGGDWLIALQGDETVKSEGTNETMILACSLSANDLNGGCNLWNTIFECAAAQR